MRFIIQTPKTPALKQKSCREHSVLALLPVTGKSSPITCALTWRKSCQTYNDLKTQSNGRGEYYPVKRYFKTTEFFFLFHFFWKDLQLRGFSPALLGFLLHTSEKRPGPVQSTKTSAKKQTALCCGPKPSQQERQLLQMHCLGARKAEPMGQGWS